MFFTIWSFQVAENWFRTFFLFIVQSVSKTILLKHRPWPLRLPECFFFNHFYLFFDIIGFFFLTFQSKFSRDSWSRTEREKEKKKEHFPCALWCLIQFWYIQSFLFVVYLPFLKIRFDLVSCEKKFNVQFLDYMLISSFFFSSPFTIFGRYDCYCCCAPFEFFFCVLKMCTCVMSFILAFEIWITLFKLFKLHLFFYIP